MVGAVHPEGIVTVTPPADIPPAAATYLITTVVAVPTTTLEGEADAVPDPSADNVNVTEGEAARFVSVPPDVDFSEVANDAAPAEAEVIPALAPPPEP